MIRRYMQSFRIPINYAWLIIFALIPQSISQWKIASLIAKVVIILAFSVRITGYSRVRLVGKDFILLLLYSANIIFPLFWGGGSTAEALQDVFILILTFLMFYVVPREILNGNSFDVLSFYKIFSYFIVAACVYNIIINYNGLLHITSLSVYSRNEIRSFFDNKNTFGFFLMYGIFSSAILRVRTREKKWIFFILLMILNELMAMCRSAIVMSIIALLLVIAGDKRQGIRRYLVIIVLVSAALYAIAIFSGLHKLITENIFGDTNSLYSRVDFIHDIYPNVTGLYRIIGYGSSTARRISYYYTGVKYFHNSFLQAFVEGGLIRVLIIASFLMHTINNSLRVRKVDVLSGNICLVSIIMYVVYSFAESVLLFDSPVASLTATIFVIAIPSYIHSGYYNSVNDVGVKNDL